MIQLLKEERDQHQILILRDSPYTVWLNGAEREILRWYGHLAKQVEGCALSHIRKTHNPYLVQFTKAGYQIGKS